MKHGPLVASFLLFIALCASAAYWGMQLFKPPVRTVTAPPPPAAITANLNAAGGLFGGRASTAVASNFQLRGVVVSGNSSDSVAILSADGKPPQAVRANSEVMPGVIVKEVHKQFVVLSDGGVMKRVELPEEAKAEGNMSPAPNRAAPPAARNTPPAARNMPPAPPPRVVVSPTPQATAPAPAAGTPPVTAPAPATGTPPAQITPSNAYPQPPGGTGAPGMPGPAGVQALPESMAPGSNMSGGSIGYNPAGSQSAASPARAMPAPSAMPGQPAYPAQPVPQQQPQSLSGPGIAPQR